MEIRISNLKTEFNNITLIRSKIINVFESLKNKSDKLKNLYSEYIKQSNTQLFVFGLDSFHFQSKLIDLEYDDMKRIFLFVNNRMYCEYFKLYKLISCYVIENVTDKKILEITKGNNFPVYKDLEPFKDYKFEITIDIHENILVLLNSIASIINNRENELSIHRSKQLIGLNIDNFVNSFNYEITLMKEKVNLFLSYIEFFHKLHDKYLKRFSNKIQLMSNHINSDIQFDETAENNTTTPNKKNDEYLIENEEVLYNSKIVNNNTIVENKKNKNTNLKLELDTSDFNNNNNIFEYYESDLNTPSDNSYKSSESKNKKMKMPKFIKNGFKKVSDMITGCNNKENTLNISENSDLLSENNSSFSEPLFVSLNDFSDNISEGDIKIQEKEQDFNSVVLETPVIIAEYFEENTVNEKETRPESNQVVEEPVPVVEEPVPVVEEPVPVVEEPVPVVEEPVPVVEEPVPVVEEPVPVVEEPAQVVEEPVPVVEESAQVVEEPVPVVEEPVSVVEEPVPVVEEPAQVVEEPVPVVEESAQVVEEPVPVVEESAQVVEEPPSQNE